MERVVSRTVNNVTTTPLPMPGTAISPRVLISNLRHTKGGTSALYRYLRHHPDLFLPDEKELHFFDDETQAWPNADLEQLRQHFKKQDPTNFAVKRHRLQCIGTQLQNEYGSTIQI